MNLSLVRIPKKVLSTKTLPVQEGEDLTDVVAQMYEVMCDNYGIGLAAPQVGLCKRFFIWDHDKVAINPEIYLESRASKTHEEGCLSVPGARFAVRRFESVVLKAFDLQWNPFEIRATGLQSRMFQHEVDHLDGIMIHTKKSKK